MDARTAFDRLDAALLIPPTAASEVRQVLRALAKASYQKGYAMSERCAIQSEPNKLEQAYHMGRTDYAAEALNSPGTRDFTGS